MVIVLFFTIMNVLLWRAEYSRDARLGSRIPVELVWEKILTAPDNSSLEVRYRNKSIGYCRLVPNIDQAIATGKRADPARGPPALEGMVRDLSGYTLKLEGSVELNSPTNRFKFELEGRFSEEMQWREITLNIVRSPYQIDVIVSAESQTVKLKVDTGKALWEKTFARNELQDPTSLLKGLGIPSLAKAQTLFQGMSDSTAQQEERIVWEARSHWMKLGGSEVRVYRLSTVNLENYGIELLVSRVGEILRVEMPQDIRLVNDGLTGF